MDKKGLAYHFGESIASGITEVGCQMSDIENLEDRYFGT